MGWNGSDKKAGAAVPAVRNCENKDKGVGKGLVAGALVVALVGAVVWWFVGGRGETRPAAQDEKHAQQRIAEVTPVVVTNASEKPMPKPVDPNARPTKSCEIVNGYVKLPSGRIHKISGVITNSIANRHKARYEIFKRNCNNVIAGYLSIQPGDAVVGTPNFGGKFTKDFVESISEPIVVSEDDSPHDAQLKRDVIAARLELKDAMDRGEDIEKIMLDTHQELQRLMVAKMQFKKLFYEERKNCKTEQEVEDLFSACNKMLEEKGVAPLTYGPITKRNLMRSQLEGTEQN